MNISNRPPKANAIALLIVGIVTLGWGLGTQLIILIIIGVASLFGASHYLRVASDQAKPVEDDPQG